METNLPLDPTDADSLFGNFEKLKTTEMETNLPLGPTDSDSWCPSVSYRAEIRSNKFPDERRYNEDDPG